MADHTGRMEAFTGLPINAIPFIYGAALTALVVALVPKAEIRRLFIYGLIFGGVFDILLVSLANLFGEFRYVHYEPYGLAGIHFMAPISWSIFFIMFFYFMPERRLFIYVYVAMGILYAVSFCQMITKLGVLTLAHGLIDSTIPFLFWFPLATWGYLRLERRPPSPSTL